jgi:hypothetical protein
MLVAAIIPIVGLGGPSGAVAGGRMLRVDAPGERST